MLCAMTQGDLIHVWYRCHACLTGPIAGRRFTCQTCPSGPDNDLCEACYQKLDSGEVRHPAEGTPAALMEPREHIFENSEGSAAESFRAWLRPEHPPAADPPLAERFVVRPEFRSGVDSFVGAYAFVVKVDGRSGAVLLTALHIMDEMIKKNGVDPTDGNPDYTGRELPALLTKVQLYDAFAANWVLAELGSASSMLVLPRARTHDEEPYSDRDIAAFEIRDPAPFSPGRLASGPPRVGEPIWLAARAQEDPNRKLLKAVVVESGERTLVFRFEDSSLEARYSSGAPLLDRTGRVVGINVGGGWLDGDKLGHANHVGSIRRHLASSLPG